MKYIADLHIHSPFSRATSKDSNLQGLAGWAGIKGIQVIGTGDFTHPGWFSQLQEFLEPAEPGFFKLKDENIPSPLEIAVEPIARRFVLTAEISSIYKRHDKVRKIHNILFVPDFDSARRVNQKLAAIGNIESDGRPILGLDSRNLLEILLENARDGFLVPAHIWTPWFSLFGSKSGFDSLEECFGDLAPHIFALETGLSSDPEMNRMVSALDRFTLISNSDCHSPGKLGREANFFDTGFDYFSMRDALQDNSKGFAGTIEFFPEEGKYHWDGHRKCQVCLDPVETRKLNNICPVCKRPLTIGVSHRVRELADRESPGSIPGSPYFTSLIPLPEVLGELLQCGPNTKTVQTQYRRIIAACGSEFNFFLNTPEDEISQKFSPVLGEAVKRIRAGEVIRHPGYDGEFGVIKVFDPGELRSIAGQAGLFGSMGRPAKVARHQKAVPGPLLKIAKECRPVSATSPNPEQQQAVNAEAGRLLVTAGPGTGKTFTLVARIVRLLKTAELPPESFTVITFTNKAASELRDRLLQAVGDQANKIFIGTFHTFCFSWLRRIEPGLAILADEDQQLFIRKHFPELNHQEQKKFLHAPGEWYRCHGWPDPFAPGPDAHLRRYWECLADDNLIDLDGIIPRLVFLLRGDQNLRRQITDTVRQLFVDEFQDLNASQYELVEVLAQQADVFAIGDPDQAIYSFQGADPECFFRFQEKESTLCLALQRNYRSSQVIIEAATAVIRHNRTHGMAQLLAEKIIPGPIVHFQASTPGVEADYIARQIEKILGGTSHLSIHSRQGAPMAEDNYGFNDIAVLCRMRQQANPIAEALDRKGIPYQLVGGRPYYMAPEVRPLYYWLQIAAPQAAVSDYLNLLQGMKGFGRTTIERLADVAPPAADFFIQAIGLADRKQRNILQQLQDGQHDFLVKIRQAGLQGALAAACPLLNVVTSPGVTRLVDLATAFGTDLHSFAAHLREQAQATIYDERAEAVALMTMHSAKGLEFPVVFIAGLEKNMMPWIAAAGRQDIEEERRLFYVALTRAEEKLILTSPAQPERISPFLAEIPARLLQPAASGSRSPGKKRQQLRLF